MFSDTCGLMLRGKWKNFSINYSSPQFSLLRWYKSENPQVYRPSHFDHRSRNIWTCRAYSNSYEWWHVLTTHTRQCQCKFCTWIAQSNDMTEANHFHNFHRLVFINFIFEDSSIRSNEFFFLHTLRRHIRRWENETIWTREHIGVNAESQ